MPGARNQQLYEFATRWSTAGHGQKNIVLDEAVRTLGMSRATLHRKFKEMVVTNPRRQRSDSGKTALTKKEAFIISGVLLEHMRKNGKRIKSVAAALDELRACGMVSATRTDLQTGEIHQLSVSTVIRALRTHRAHPDQLLQPAPVTPLASRHPNHVWQIDASRCVMYYLPTQKGDNGLRIANESEFYKNKPDALIKAIKHALWRYVITDHASGWIFVFYVTGGETAENLINTLIEAMQKREREAMHGVPAMVMLDPGSANTSAAFKNLCQALRIRLQINTPGNPRAKGQVEKAQDIVERGFESLLKTLSPSEVDSLDKINLLAKKWRRYFNGTTIHSRHGMTRDSAWLRITPEQLIVAPAAELIRQLAVSAPELRKVSPQLTVSYLGKEYDASAVPGVMVGEKLNICRNPMHEDSAQAIGVGEDGRDVYYVLPLRERDDFGQVVGAAIIGETYKRHADTPAQENAAAIERIVMGAETNEQATALRKSNGTRFDGRYDPFAHIDSVPVPDTIPRRGTQHDLTATALQLPPLTHIQAAKQLREHVTGWSGDHYAWLQQHYPEGVPTDSLGEVLDALMADMHPEQLQPRKLRIA